MTFEAVLVPALLVAHLAVELELLKALGLLTIWVICRNWSVHKEGKRKEELVMREGKAEGTRRRKNTPVNAIRIELGSEQIYIPNRLAAHLHLVGDVLRGTPLGLRHGCVADDGFDDLDYSSVCDLQFYDVLRSTSNFRLVGARGRRISLTCVGPASMYSLCTRSEEVPSWTGPTGTSMARACSQRPVLPAVCGCFVVASAHGVMVAAEMPRCFVLRF